MFVLGIAVALARDLPHLLAGGRIEGDHPRAAGVNQLHVQPVLIQKRRGVHAVLRLETAIAVLRVEFPDFLAVEIETGELARADEHEDVLAVGARRGGSAVPLVAANRPVGAELAFPKLLAVRARAHQHQVVAVLARQKDVLLPDGGRRAPHSRHLELPQDVRRLAPRRGQIRFVTEAVVIRTAPLRPVFGMGRGGRVPFRATDRSHRAGSRVTALACRLCRAIFRGPFTAGWTFHRAAEPGRRGRSERRDPRVAPFP